MQNYKELIVWQKAHQHVLLVYKYTKSFPKEEQFGLTNQLRRAAASIPSNIAEGAGKSTKKDFANYLQSALGFPRSGILTSFKSRTDILNTRRF